MNSALPESAPPVPGYAELAALLSQFGQEHTLAWWHQLAPAEQANLARQLAGLDLPLLAQLAGGHHASENWTALAARATSPTAIRLHGSQPPHSASEARSRGEALLRAGQVGMLLVAGGQGTRLGFARPKGMFELGPVSRRPLFQILIDRLRAIARRHQTRIPLFLMTSPATHDDTIAFLEAHQRFGLPADDLTIFCQGTMPAVDARTGKLLLESKGSLALSPDGHGGMLAALARAGALETCQRRGITELFYGQIDNPLLQVCDETFLGYHVLTASEMTSQVVAKVNPGERVGVLVEIEGRMQLIEYSDLPAEQAERRDSAGTLYHWAGSLAVHALNVNFLARQAAAAGSLPFHLARKKVAHLDAHGQTVQPAEPNALKFERFIFDLLPAARNALVVEVERAEAFAPVKNDNSAPTDSPRTSQAAMCAQARRLLRAAGSKVADAVEVEINPLFALDAAELRQKLPPGTLIERPTYFAP